MCSTNEISLFWLPCIPHWFGTALGFFCLLQSTLHRSPVRSPLPFVLWVSDYPRFYSPYEIQSITTLCQVRFGAYYSAESVNALLQAGVSRLLFDCPCSMVR
ncbi:hypothetical protein P692DRAFT_20340992 [Suillus brevipes Sb2]|nr:hypothetical protein P692DRAFT_20340992 [Suillus brevipes Sb2]